MRQSVRFSFKQIDFYIIDAGLQTEKGDISEEDEEENVETLVIESTITATEALEHAEKIREFAVNAGYPKVLDQVTELQYSLKAVQLESKKNSQVLWNIFLFYKIFSRI